MSRVLPVQLRNIARKVYKLLAVKIPPKQEPILHFLTTNIWRNLTKKKCQIENFSSFSFPLHALNFARELSILFIHAEAYETTVTLVRWERG